MLDFCSVFHCVSPNSLPKSSHERPCVHRDDAYARVRSADFRRNRPFLAAKQVIASLRRGLRFFLHLPLRGVEIADGNDDGFAAGGKPKSFPDTNPVVVFGDDRLSSRQYGDAQGRRNPDPFQNSVCTTHDVNGIAGTGENR